MWSKGVERNLTGEKRLENKSPFERYLDTVEWIDLGHDVLYAKDDNETDGLFSLNDINEILSVLPTNVSIMNKNHVKFLQDTCKIILYQDIDDKIENLYTSVCCVNPETHEFINFKLNKDTKNQVTTYFIKTMEFDKGDELVRTIYNRFTDFVELTEIGPKKFPSYLGTVKRIHMLKSEQDVKKYKIKVVKLKDDGDKKI